MSTNTPFRCLTCNRDFLNNAGLSSHLRSRTHLYNTTHHNYQTHLRSIFPLNINDPELYRTTIPEFQEEINRIQEALNELQEQINRHRSPESYMHEITNETLNTDDTCSICLGNYTDCDMKIMELNTCKHIFHSDCVAKWVETSHNYTCPLCRTTL